MKTTCILSSSTSCSRLSEDGFDVSLIGFSWWYWLGGGGGGGKVTADDVLFSLDFVDVIRQEMWCVVVMMFDSHHPVFGIKMTIQETIKIDHHRPPSENVFK